MANVSSMCVLISFALSCAVLLANGMPQPTEEYPYIVELDVNNLLLYNIASKISSGPELSDDEVRSVLTKVLNTHHITLEGIDLSSVFKTLKQKVKSLFQKSKKCVKAGGKSVEMQLRKWKETEYSLKLPHKSGSPTKRKLQEDVQEEKSKRIKLESELTVLTNKLEQTEGKNLELERRVQRLKNPMKKQKGGRGKNKNKLKYTPSQKYRHQANALKEFKSTVQEGAKNAGFTPIKIEIQNDKAKTINLIFEEREGPITETDIDEMLFILDSFNIPQKGYHELAQRFAALPRLFSINERKQSINSECRVKEIDVVHGKIRITGVYRSLEDCLTSVLSDQKRSHLIVNNKVKIKISGDGTRAGKKTHLVNVTITIIGEESCKSEQGNYLLAILKCPETHSCLKVALSDLIEEFDGLSEITIDGKIVSVEKYLGGDLKFLNQVTGIASFASKYSCLWCKCPKESRYDMTKTWSMTDEMKGARSVKEILNCASKKMFGCIAEPLFRSIPVINIVPDTLHLFLRISDQMIYQIIKYLQDEDNFVRISEERLSKCQHLQRFKQFIENVGIPDWKFFISDGKLNYDSFTGPEHRRIMENINFDTLIPDHPKLSGIKSLWTDFKVLMDSLNQNMSDDQISDFEKAARKWVDLYGSNLFLSKDVTPYMHIFSNHLPEAMRLHGNVVDFCQQGLEKLNHLVTKWYFRSTNFSKAALKQIIHKQFRINKLEGKCRRAPKFQMTCTACNKSGHNKRTCKGPENTIEFNVEP
nr:LOW QUALITY PROTEIN: uncharacterized protein LOC129256207 [Lytechinus pictus]